MGKGQHDISYILFSARALPKENNSQNIFSLQQSTLDTDEDKMYTIRHLNLKHCLCDASLFNSSYCDEN